MNEDKYEMVIEGELQYGLLLVIRGQDGCKFEDFINLPESKDLEIHRLANKLQQMKESIESILERLKGEKE